ncbi:MAG: flagellin lysine-N-methylase [Oscillospiraceae bacterium]|nr:flagellin lysine-N-methylase [Oscillospiraceae bacterium]
MMLKVPDYFISFKCAADQCRHTCCAGWEIDIDADTADYYANLPGSFGEELRANIDFGGETSFRLKNDRCPFLRQDGLCDIIIHLGHDKLCRICAEHPRYYEWYGSVKEGGVGMCCEEAAKLILLSGGDSEILSLETDEVYEDIVYSEELYAMLSFARSEILTRLRDRNRSLASALTDILIYAERLQEKINAGEYLPLALPNVSGYPVKESSVSLWEVLKPFGDMESIGPRWEKLLSRVLSTAEKRGGRAFFTAENETYLRGAAVYFIWRHFLGGVFDEDILSKVKFMAVSLIFLAESFTAAKAPDLESYAALCAAYSEETEYSAENLALFAEYSDTLPCWSTENILTLFM